MNGSSSDLIAAIRSDRQRSGALAVAGVLLALTVLVATVRMADIWSDEAFCVISLVAFVLLFGLALLLRDEGRSPSAAQSALLVAGLLMALEALVFLANLTTDDPTSGTGAWAAGLFTVITLKAVYLHRSSVCTLIAALSFGSTVLYFVDWVFDPSGGETFRWVVLGMIAFYALAAYRLRSSAPDHSTQFINVTAIATLSLVGLTIYGGVWAAYAPGPFSGLGETFQDLLGWQIVIGLIVLGLLLYALITRERGPAFLAGINLIVFGLVVGPSKASNDFADALGEPATLMGWPLILAIVTALAFTVALRPKDSNESSGGSSSDPVISSEENGI